MRYPFRALAVRPTIGRWVFTVTTLFHTVRRTLYIEQVLGTEERAQLAPLDAKALQKVIAVESSSTALYREEKGRRICVFIRFAVYTAVLA